MREQASSLYDVGPYFVSKWLAELPFSLIDATIVSVFVYWLIGFNTETNSKFFIFCNILLNNIISDWNGDELPFLKLIRVFHWFIG
jgi:hypothetical protein